MMFWDSSALVPLLAAETSTARRERQLQTDPVIAAWWSSPVECASALNRLAREGRLPPAALATALRALDELTETWVDVLPTARIRRRAMRLLRVHALRAADALQLSAGLEVCEGDPRAVAFCSADERLCEAAEKEGVRVLR